MRELPITLSQLGTILFFGGFSWWAIRLAGRNLRDQIVRGQTKPRLAVLTSDEVDAIVARKLASPVELFNMSPSEQRLLAQTAVAMVTATQQIPTMAAEPGPPPAYCPACGTAVENFPEHVPWRCECTACGAELVLRRDGRRFVFSYTPRA
ncbi:MAG: hypothetical protein OEW77_02340 [Gemmatimonadota bacterium]|nr:hypothetical protein [Gemmatimonadota bacterium]